MGDMNAGKGGNGDKAGARKRHRSPNYPAIGLRRAVEKVQALYTEDGKPGAPLETALKYFGYTSPHGQALATLSAIKKFGLVEDRSGRIVPTAVAISILEYPEGHERRTNALREAAVRPEIYAELLEQYREFGRLPSDDALRPELITDKGFNPKAVDDFLADFRDTLEFAGLLDGNTLKLTSAALETPEGKDVTLTKDLETLNPLIPPPAEEAPYISFPLPRDNVIEIKLRSKLSPQEFNTVKKLIDLSEDSLVARVSMILSSGLTQEETVKFNRLEHALAELFLKFGYTLRVFCRGEGDSKDRKISFVTVKGPLVSIPAAQFIDESDEQVLATINLKLSAK